MKRIKGRSNKWPFAKGGKKRRYGTKGTKSEEERRRYRPRRNSVVVNGVKKRKKGGAGLVEKTQEDPIK